MASQIGQLQKVFSQRPEKKGQMVFHGICHECRAGQTDIPFEQVSTTRPLWANTFFEEDPFTAPSPFLVVPHDSGKLPSLWTWDFFHTWHLGVAKRFIGSILAQLCRQATIAINTCVRTMYKADLWLNKSQCLDISRNGLRFIRRFEELAKQSRDQGKNLFELAPKIHPLQKIFLRLHWGAAQDIEQLNPLSVSVQQCEDFISRPSRLARRVTGGQRAPERVMDRYLMASYPQWIAAGYLVRPV